MVLNLNLIVPSLYVTLCQNKFIYLWDLLRVCRSKYEQVHGLITYHLSIRVRGLIWFDIVWNLLRVCHSIQFHMLIPVHGLKWVCGLPVKTGSWLDEFTD